MPKEKDAAADVTAASLLGLTQDDTKADDDESEDDVDTKKDDETDADDDNSETDSESDEDESSDADDDTDEDSGDEEDEEETTLKPDEIILEALKDNPKALKRVKEQFKGLAKKDKQLQVAQQSVQTLIDYGQKLMDPARFEATLETILTESIKQHGVKAEDVLVPILKKLAPTMLKAKEAAPASTEDIEFEYEGDKTVYEAALKASEKNKQEAIDEAKRQTLELLGIDPAEFKTILASLKTREAETQENAWVDANAPRIKAKAEKTLGWSVTDKMILQAKREFPNAEDPILALKKAFPDEYAKARTPKAPKKGPEMVQGGTPKAKPQSTKPMHEWTVADILAANNP